MKSKSGKKEKAGGCEESPSRKRDVYTIVLEDLRGQFKVFGESLSGFRKKAEEKFDQIDGRFDRFETETRENFKVVNEYLLKIDDRLNDIGTELKEIKSDLKKIDESKVGKKDFEAVKARIFDCENRLKLMEKQLKIAAA